MYLLRGAAARDVLKLKKGCKLTSVDKWVTDGKTSPLEEALADKTKNHSLFEVPLFAGDEQKLILGRQFECLPGTFT